MTDKQLKERIQAILLAVMIGDTRGMPVESMTREEILKATGGKGVCDYLDAIQKTFKSLAEYKAGQTTDDWSGNRAIIKSIIKMGDYDFEDSILEQLEEYHLCETGLGPSSITAFKQIEEHYVSSGARGRSPFVSAPFSVPGQGSGNGVAIKIMAIAIWFFMKRDWKNDNELFEIILQQGLATHPDKRASIAAFLIAWLIVSNLVDPVNGSPEKNKVKLSFMAHLAKTIEWGHKLENLEDNLSCRLEKIVENDLLNDLDALIEKNGNSCSSLESIPFSIAVFFRHPTDFRAAIEEAINSGGDTDSNAAMVGALVAANCGLEVIPPEWIAPPLNYDEALNLGYELFKVLKKK